MNNSTVFLWKCGASLKGPARQLIRKVFSEVEFTVKFSISQSPETPKYYAYFMEKFIEKKWKRPIFHLLKKRNFFFQARFTSASILSIPKLVDPDESMKNGNKILFLLCQIKGVPAFNAI